MYYEFYIDQFVAEQFLIWYVLLALCAWLQKRMVSWRRLALGSLCCAGVSALFLCAGIPQGSVTGVLAAGTIVFAGKKRRQTVQDMGMLLLVSVCFAGTLEAVLDLLSLLIRRSSFGKMAAGITIAGILLWKGWKLAAKKRKLAGRCFAVRLYQGKQSQTLQAIWDTGNQLTEPLTGKPVSIVEAGVVRELLGEAWEQKIGCFLIPYHSLGTEKSWMRAAAIDRLELILDGETIAVSRPVLALYEGKISSRRSYQMILHPKHLDTS